MRLSHVSGERPTFTSWQHSIYALHRYSPYVICDGHPHSLARICKERLDKKSIKEEGVTSRHAAVTIHHRHSHFLQSHVFLPSSLSLKHTLSHYAYTAATAWTHLYFCLIQQREEALGAPRVCSRNPLGPPDRGAV